ncbi:carbohydrate ABC transporter permease [Paenibacillus brevis]|uniref:Sugar ABC transporter permease n=1 Tax=Paenibacillus brevis TaxID=2841508 RepID=A0ABS6FK41_9BACL|nr:sugar ABC transporter permease [Paenibacillus brevis]MBU5670499.1 sugar ABC transporter permease [Paenibacillus brevis]
MNLRKLGEPQAYLFILPALVPYVIFWLAPMVYVVYLSFVDWDFMNPVKTFVGWENYSRLLTDAKFYQALTTTCLFALGNVLPSLVGGLFLALLLNRKLRGMAFFRTVIFLPWVTPTVAVSIVWSWIYEPRVGLANAILGWFGAGGLEWTKSPDTALISILIVTIWKGLGWTMMFYLVALQNIPESLHEAAMIEGANRRQRLMHITLPLISPTTFFLFLITTIDSIQAYDQINVLTQGGPSGSTRTLLYLFYESAFERFEIGEASAVAIVLILLLAMISLVSLYVSRRRIHYL